MSQQHISDKRITYMYTENNYLATYQLKKEMITLVDFKRTSNLSFDSDSFEEINK